MAGNSYEGLSCGRQGPSWTVYRAVFGDRVTKQGDVRNPVVPQWAEVGWIHDTVQASVSAAPRFSSTARNGAIGTLFASAMRANSSWRILRTPSSSRPKVMSRPAATLPRSAMTFGAGGMGLPVMNHFNVWRGRAG